MTRPSPLGLEYLEDRLSQRSRHTQRHNAELALSLQSLQIRAFGIGVGRNERVRSILQRIDHVRREVLSGLNQGSVTTEVSGGGRQRRQSC